MPIGMIKKLLYSVLFFCSLPGRAQQGDVAGNLYLFEGEDPQLKIARNLFCSAEASRHTVFTGQPLVVTLKLYSALESHSVVEKTPGFNGFSTYDITSGREPYDETINGRLYRCHIIRKLQLYPLEPGSFTLEPVEVNNTVTFRKIAGRSIDDALAKGGGAALEQHQYKARTKPVVITVMPLPEKNKPEGFTGATGNFALDAACGVAETAQYGALKVTYTLSGNGNFKMINTLPLNWPAGVEAFDPEISEEIDENLTPFAGKKIFTYTISATQPGLLTLPPAAFYFYNPAKGGYQLAQSESIKIMVTPAQRPAAANQEPVLQSATQKQGIAIWWFLAGGVLLMTAVAILLVVRKRKNKAETLQPATVPEPEPVHTPFHSSKTMLALGETGRFFTVLRQELTKEAARELKLPEAATARDIQNALGNEQLATGFAAFIQELDMALYASGPGGRSAADCLALAQELVYKMKPEAV